MFHLTDELVFEEHLDLNFDGFRYLWMELLLLLFDRTDVKLVRRNGGN